MGKGHTHKKIRNGPQTYKEMFNFTNNKKE